jgi:hypothetical protein
MLPKGYVCGRAAEPLVIDGDLTKPAWQAAPWTDAFVDIEGDAKPAPRWATRAKMLWDDDFFYIAAELEEPHIWATLTEHDSVIFQDNDFEVFIDPDGDNHQYYEVEINALNTVWDLRLVKPYRDGGPALDEWEIPGLKTAVRIDGTLNDPTDTDRGWTVEMALPWSVLAEFARRPTPPRSADQWRVNFSRVEWDVEIADGGYRKIAGAPERNWVWSPQGAIDMHRPEKWGYVQFSTNAPGATITASDPSAGARDLLMGIYHAQRAYQRQVGSWALTLDDIAFRMLEGNSALPTLRATTTGYIASVAYSTADGEARMLYVREDSRLWSEEPT